MALTRWFALAAVALALVVQDAQAQGTPASGSPWCMCADRSYSRAAPGAAGSGPHF